MTEKLTKQGVRDLNHLKAPSRKQYAEPPVPINCRHRRKREVFLTGVVFVICEDCNKTISEY